ncbi:MAG: hypothetical protein WAX36_08330, partial [Ruminococcus bromii]
IHEIPISLWTEVDRIISIVPDRCQILLYEKHGLCFVTTVFEICPAYVYCDGEICIRYNKTVEGTVILISLLLLKKQNKNVTLRE